MTPNDSPDNYRGNNVTRYEVSPLMLFPVGKIKGGNVKPRIVVLATAYDALVQRLRDVEGALRGLVDKLSNPKTKEGIRSAFMLAQVHGFTYMGPSWEPELEYAAKVLKAPTSQGWTSERSTVEG